MEDDKLLQNIKTNYIKKPKVAKRRVTVDKMKMNVEKKKVGRRRYTDRCIDISVKYCFYFEQDYNRVMYEMEVEKKMIDKEKKMIELYEKTYKKTDVGFCLLLNTSLSKDVIEIIREYFYVDCEECHYMDVENIDFVKIYKSINKALCKDCVQLFFCRYCNRELWHDGGCWHCD